MMVGQNVNSRARSVEYSVLGRQAIHSPLRSIVTMA